VIESISTRIVSIAHAHKKNGEIEKNGSLTKYYTPQALENALSRLNNITHITTNCSNAMLKYIENVLNKINKHKNVKHAKDIWHISKNIPARWTSFINKKKKEAQKKKWTPKCSMK
jgi:hypothetical protein